MITPYKASKFGAIFLVVALALNAVAFIAGVKVPNQAEAVAGMLLMLAFFLYKMRKHR